MSIYLVEEKEELKLDHIHSNYRWIPRVRATSEDTAFYKMNELKSQNQDKWFRVVKLLS